ncbi:hypothetical protein QP958_08890 [Corynebacterium marquesiae]|uniref:hypothetical protein n=1 Tax=Corynebacterium marquesiae TaxID=2913503 RepID=UPI00254DB7FB|nr:hypothetical protein [Corynebacterium marquesiae]MDK8455515.1 hypothetical protein [Corynebacterium marquesiae]MDK8725632.1 hypothetical protein [Corynebacterium marquesiae]MDK8770976.1 hypothetical protein [Corynebacterium marquesiae]
MLNVQSLKSAARRGAIISVTAVSALALASCSAGQVTQTADKVAAVDGASASTDDNKVAVRDVTILVEPDGSAALKFSAVNQGYDTDVISLESVKVDGQRVEMDKAQPLHRDQSIIADSQKNLDATTQQDSESVQYIATKLKNDDFGYAGDRPVTFEFSNGSVDVDATIAATQMQSGEFDRDVESAEGYSSEAPKN